MIGRVLCIVLLFWQIGVSAPAQESSKSQKLEVIRGLIEDEAGADASAGERDLHQLVEQILMLRLRDAVSLTDDQVQALTRRVGTFKNQLTSMKFQRGAAREQLRDRLDRGLAEDQIRRNLESLLDREEAIAELLHEMIREAGKDLSVPQTARLYLFVGDFESFIRNLIVRAQYIDRHGAPPEGIGSAKHSTTGSTEQSLLEELINREAAGPTGREAEDSDMVALFDGLLIARLSRALDLDPEETIVLFHRVGTYKDQLHELKWQVGAARYGLADALDRGAPDSAIEKMLEDLLLQEEAVAVLIRLLVTESQKDVPLAKSARLYLFVGDFEDYVGRLFQRVEEMRSAAPARP